MMPAKHETPVDKAIPEAQEINPRLLTKAGKATRNIIGTFLFVGWLTLFVLGLSLDSTTFRACIIPADRIDWYYLTLYAVSLTPTNVALLASLAGALGGIASNLAASNKFSIINPASLSPNSTDFQSYLYMTESPLVSLLRGFITFMIFIAGSYLTNFTSSIDTNNAGEFTGLTASSYTRFAVTVSLLAYMAGYDPSRIQSLLKSFNLTKKESEPTVIQADVHSIKVTDTHLVANTDRSPQNILQPKSM
ncbi:hypothetical protein [Spirosoma fluviale]|uniref:Uncharacterized protein n=1 Tax=Spirosoma fluviale TaxID=1597977 RepID=A0A286GAK4_9BACT|nr:hypothetical protein [Spirosoma fluviale]SOD92518.1 hypothetical protein SAMN06269250_4019 [Spirosoma fluviale]